MKVVVVGAGPAGLTAAEFLTREGVSCEVLERDSQVGGLAKTVEYKGFRFDIGGHRFFTRVPWIRRFWEEVAGADLLTVSRLSRIYYEGKLLRYPVQVPEALMNLGIAKSLRVMSSYATTRVFPVREESFEDYMINSFGRELYRLFFKEYTEKVWGIPCHEISSEWARQRIRGVSLLTAALHTLYGNSTRRPKTLIDQFVYPRLGPGMIWERIAQRVTARGNPVHLDSPISRIRHSGGRITGVEVKKNGHSDKFEADEYMFTVPVRYLVEMLDPAAPDAVLEAARKLRYRDFIAVNLIVDRTSLFPDQWIYIQTGHVDVARIQNYRNWSRQMVPDPRCTSLGMEYFCSKGDRIWNKSDQELLDQASREIREVGLLSRGTVLDGHVVRETEAYPVYSSKYRNELEKVKTYLAGFANLQTMGRNGCHRYNNQDHSMLCGRYAVENLFGARHNLWEVDPDTVDIREDVSGSVGGGQQFPVSGVECPSES